MKKYILPVFISIPILAFAQSSPSGLIIGDAVRIRESGSANSKEVSKVYGSRNVEIIEESEAWDDLGKKDDICARHKWVKVKWKGDSTGWVYGRYVYQVDPEKFLQQEIGFNKEKYQLVILRNYSYPVGDDIGLTGCIWWYKVHFWNNASGTYFPIYDTQSKKEFTTMTLESSAGAGESIKSIHSDGKKVYIKTDISYQEGSAEADYVIEWKKDRFEVTSFVQGATKY